MENFQLPQQWFVAMTFILLGSSACHHTPPKYPIGVGEVTGCWKLTVTGDNSDKESPESWPAAGSLPPVFELDSTRVTQPARTDTLFHAYSWFDGRRETTPFSVWQPIPGDSIRVQQQGALSGLVLRLTFSDDSLTGVVVGFSDISQLGKAEQQRRPVTAGPIHCPNR